MRVFLLVSEPLLGDPLAEMILLVGDGVEMTRLATLSEFERALSRGVPPDLLFISDPFDRSQPDELIDAARANWPDVSIVLFSDFEGPSRILDAFDRGAAACIPRSTGSEIMVHALRMIRAGGRYVPPEVLAMRTAPDPYSDDPAEVSSALTRRQRLVLGLMSKGLSNREIAEELGINVGTVKSHVHTILRILDAKSRTEAVIMAIQSGLVSPGLSSE